MKPTCATEGCPRLAWKRGLCAPHYAVAPRIRERHDGCRVGGCARPHEAKGWCAVHYMRVKRFGDPGPVGKISGADHRHWKGDEVGYAAAHDRIVKVRGLASEWACAHCAVPAEGWAYTHHAVNELVSVEGWAYSTDPDDYIPLCQSCHKVFDSAVRQGEEAHS